MKLSIYSLKKILFQGEAELLNCKTITGEITVLDNHEEYIGVLTQGVMRVIEKRPQSNSSPSAQFDGASHFFEVQSGFLEVKPGNEVRCLVD
ncbi:MAG: F0F1 ATP synthase subunit epsilon [Patescibacteria group bacterium]